MDVRNCRTCGKLFNYIGGASICPACNKALDEKFILVKDYIYKNPGVGMNEVSEAIDVSVPQIQKWIREERLAFTEGSLAGIECENCGATILTGRFCKACKDKLANNLDSIYKEPDEPPKKINFQGGAKMRFLDSVDKKKG